MHTPAHSPRPPRPPRTWSELAVLLPVFGATLLFGGVHAPVQAGLAALTVALSAAVLATTPAARGPGRLTVGWALAAAALTCAAAAPLVPVGPGVRAALQPVTGPLVEASLAQVGGGAHPLALAPGEAAIGLAWAAALAALTVATAALHRPRDRARRAKVALVCLGLLSLALHAAHRAADAPAIWWVSGVPSGGLRAPFAAPFVNPNHAGALYSALLPLAGALVLRREQTFRALGALGLLGLSAGVWWTGSRGALVSAAAGLAAAAALAGPRWAQAGVGLFAAGSAGAVALAGPLSIARRLDAALPTPQRLQDPLGQRAALWADALQLIREQPLGLVGAGGFGRSWEAVRALPLYVSVDHAHNDLLQAIIEHGPLVALGGAALLLVPLGAGAAAALRADPSHGRERIAAWAGVLVSLLCSSLWDFPAHIGALGALAAVAVGGLLAARGHHAHRQALPLPLAATLAPAAVLSLLGLWAAAAPGGTFLRGGQAAAVRAAVAADPAAAEAAARAILHAEPLQRTALVALAEARAAQGDLDGAAAALAVATAAAPRSPWAWFALARLEDRRGRASARRAAWQRGLANNLPDNDRGAAWVEEALASEDDPGTMVNQVVPPRADRLVDAARALAAADDELMARVVFEQAAALDPAALLPYARQALAWGDAAGALDLLKGLPTAGCEALQVRGEAELARGAAAAGAAALTAALERCRPTPPALRLRLGLARCEAGDPSGLALAEAELPTAAAPEPIRHRLVACARAQGRGRLARPHLEALEASGALTPDERALLDRLRAGLPL